jgi:hypothetical protein
VKSDTETDDNHTRVRYQTLLVIRQFNQTIEPKFVIVLDKSTVGRIYIILRKKQKEVQSKAIFVTGRGGP